MGLIVIETCLDCGHKGVPVASHDEISFKFCCRSCGSTNFEKPVVREEHMITCRCGHKYVFNDVGCSKCIAADLEKLGVKVLKIS